MKPPQHAVQPLGLGDDASHGSVAQCDGCGKLAGKGAGTGKPIVQVTGSGRSRPKQLPLAAYVSLAL